MIDITHLLKTSHWFVHKNEQSYDEMETVNKIRRDPISLV